MRRDGEKTGANTTMTSWCAELQENGLAAAYVSATLKEEVEKPGRLARVLASAGLVPQKQYSFSLPHDFGTLIRKCEELEAAGWRLTIRVVGGQSGRVVYRALDGDTRSIEEGLRSLPRQEMAATLTPNKVPALSGTVLIRSGDVVMEVVDGPHHWLTKAPPTGSRIDRCWFAFPHVSTQYSMEDRDRRAVLYQHLRTIIEICLGCDLRGCAAEQRSLYAEFQWHPQLGYRFFEVSFSWVWTD